MMSVCNVISDKFKILFTFTVGIITLPVCLDRTCTITTGLLTVMVMRIISGKLILYLWCHALLFFMKKKTEVLENFFGEIAGYSNPTK